MNEQELKDKILELESLNAVQASKIKSLEQEVEKLSKNGCYWGLTCIGMWLGIMWLVEHIYHLIFN